MTDLSSWTTRPVPGLVPLAGETVRLEPLDWKTHGEDLFAAVGGPANADIWTYMPVGPFAEPAQLQQMLEGMRENDRWRTMVARKAGSNGKVLGMATYMRIREAHGSAEIGCVAFGPDLRRTREATEVFRLMAAHVFKDLGYRRYEWKCNRNNAASMQAAQRFGFVFEGIFRNDMVAKGLSRDTAWYSITDAEWPDLDEALAGWLAPSNFAADGSRIRGLESFRRTK
ncbi:MAG: GNAT family N-acetyltransferase [Alphaproteobacteria bacterium]|nr:GNAT family N-acetyltransferase [Alphaproteobacteria bacterium]